MTICAVIVTFNRLGFLREIIDSIRNQTRKPDCIVVVNNSSTDGTEEWLSKQIDLRVIKQDNLGSSGGQWRGIKEAYELGYDWLWTMDDDVVPDANVLELLLDDSDTMKVRAPLRYTIEGKPFFNDAITYNLSNPFRSIWNDIYSESDLKNKTTQAVGITFEGPVFSRALVEKIGLPEKDFFIYGDDTEYFIRASRAGFSIFVYRDAILRRRLPYQGDPNIISWKTYYLIRNIIAIDKIHGNIFVKYLRPVAYLFIWLKRAGLKNIKLVFSAFFDGIKY